MGWAKQPNKPCADALAKYARSLDDFKEEMEKLRAANKASMTEVSNALEARAKADDAQTKVWNRYADQFSQLGCTILTPIPTPIPETWGK